MKKLINLLKNYHVMIGAGFVFLISIIWFGGGILGISKTETRLILILFIFVFWVLLLSIERFKAVRSSNKIESSLMKQADDQILNAKPGRKKEIEALRLQLTQAISSLKSSKLAKGFKGSSALYALPWYMFIGPPGSGKSTAIRQSGLKFPSLGSSESGIQGIGGTRNCDWWFTDKGILLETAGRYITEEEDKEEWLAFLTFLKKNRSKRPINGAIIAISIPELLEADEPKLEKHAAQIRVRVDELIKILGVIFPVYLVFTKCDLIDGFIDFFDDMSTTELAQVWGYTFTTTKEQKDGTSFEGTFKNEFNNLYKKLCNRRIVSLSSANSYRKKEKIYSFPLQFKEIGDTLSRFIGKAFQPNPYQEQPRLRGFYFTSGTQEGTPINYIIHQASGIKNQQAESGKVIESIQEQPATEKISYFIKDLFTEIIFPDQNIVSLSSAAERRRGIIWMSTLLLSIIVMGLFITIMSFSFIGNKKLIHGAFDEAEKLASLQKSGDNNSASNLKQIEAMRVYVEQFDKYERKGGPLKLRMGLYQGDQINSLARKIYFNRFRDTLLIPAAKSMEAKMQMFLIKGNKLPEDILPKDVFNLARAYNMLSKAALVDKEFLSPYLYEFMEKNLAGGNSSYASSEIIQPILSNQIAFYLSQIDRYDTPFLNIDMSLVENIKKKLDDAISMEHSDNIKDKTNLKTAYKENQKIPPSLVGKIYLSVKKEGMERFKAISLKTIMNNHKNISLSGGTALPEIFTVNAWNDYIKGAIEKKTDQAINEGRVKSDLSDPGIPKMREDLINSIRSLYLKEYIQEWYKFINSVHVKESYNLEEAVVKLEELSGNDSPLFQLFKEVSNNTIGFDDEVEKSFSGLYKTITPSAAQTNDTAQKDSSLGIYLKEISKLSDKLNAMNNSSDRGINAKNYVKEQLTGGTDGAVKAAWDATHDFLEGIDIDNRKIFQDIFEPFLKNIWTAVLNTAYDNINKLWQSEVYKPFHMTLENRYPFNPMGEDASLTDMGEFFRPDNGIFWKFFDNEIKPFITQKEDTWEGKKWLDQGMQLSKEFIDTVRAGRIITDSLFPKGSVNPKVFFSIYPYPIPGATEIFIQIDGKSLSYRNGLQKLNDMSWPGSASPKETKIQIMMRDNQYTAFSYGGDWGFFRLLDDAQIIPESNTNDTYKIKWTYKNTTDKEIIIEYKFKASSYKNPFGAKKEFLNFKCPDRIG